jgi:small subunit ribosomal protein S20
MEEAGRKQKRPLTDGAASLTSPPLLIYSFSMANTKTAAKRARQTERRTKQNRRVISAVKTQVKAVRASIKSGAKDASRAGAVKLASAVDKAAKTGRIHPNKANRLKSRTAKAIASLS